MKKYSSNRLQGGFSLMETVIAIGVLAVLLTAFLAVFGPAAQGIRKAISIQEADRLAYTVERELVTVRGSETTDYDTGFEKAYEWITESHDGSKALLIYQFRGDPASIRDDGTMEPYTGQGVAGQDFIVQPVVRKLDSEELEKDLKSLEGRIYAVKLTQLVFENGELTKGDPGVIEDPSPDDGDTPGSDADTYPEAVIAFASEFFVVPNSSFGYVRNKFDLNKMTKPIFTRNLAVRR